MHVAIVYESMFGNTHAIAKAIAEGARAGNPDVEVTVLPVADATPAAFSGTGLLVAGGPTHMRTMTSELTRRKGLEEAVGVRGWGPGRPSEESAGGPGVREWLGKMPLARRGSLAAAFGTRDGYLLAGGAAHAIARWAPVQRVRPGGAAVWVHRLGHRRPAPAGRDSQGQGVGCPGGALGARMAGDGRTNDPAPGRPPGATWK